MTNQVAWRVLRLEEQEEVAWRVLRLKEQEEYKLPVLFP